MLKSAIYFLVFGCLCSLLAAQSKIEDVEFQRNGSFSFGEIVFSSHTRYGEQNWHHASINAPTLKIDNDRTLFSSELLTRDNKLGRYEYQFSRMQKGMFSFSGKIEAPKDAPIKAVYLGFNISLGSKVLIDGVALALPNSVGETVIKETVINKISVIRPGGRIIEIEGRCRLLIQDNRKFSGREFEARLHYSPVSNQAENYKLDVSMNFKRSSSQIVDITNVANRIFSDDIADDGKGGWTDQGASNDLGMIEPGRMVFDQLEFEVLDEKKHAAGTVIVTGGKERKFAPSEISLPLPDNDATGVNLLHASAWTPSGELGKLIVHYADESTETFSITGRHDCGNWWAPQNLRNGFVMWRGYNSQHSIGLYASSFPLNKKSPTKITFTTTHPEATWLVVGVTLSSPAITIPLKLDQELIVREGKEWARLDFKSKIPEGSPLDFSFLVDAPAGKWGRVVATQEGELTFENASEKRFRIYGENLCERALLLDKAAADSLASYLARMGTNTVRIHHHDNALIDPNSPDSLTFNPKTLDQLDYLFAKLKENGIYMTTDLYTSRILRPGDDIPELEGLYKTRFPIKPLIPFSKATMDNWKAFVRKFLTHENPYTGMTWGEDPALVFVNLLNEDNLFTRWQGHPKLEVLYQREFDNYCAAQNLQKSHASNNNPVFRKFLDAVQIRCQQEMMAFVRDELGFKILLTSQNYYGDLPTTIVRSKFDLVDDHWYHDHPKFAGGLWGLPQTFSQISAIDVMATLPRALMPNRIFRKPFAITEFSYVAPNIYRAEGGALIGAYGALQNWNALYHFNYSSSAVNSSPRKIIHDFESANDPMAQFSGRITAALFTRGDVKPAEEKVGFLLPDDFYDTELDRQFPQDYQMLGLITQIGSLMKEEDGITVYGHPIKQQKIQALWKDALDKKIATSATGEITLDANKGSFVVRTELTESITLKKGNEKARSLSVANADTPQTVAAISLDGRPIETSRSILLFQLTDVCNSAIRFGNETKTWLDSKGTLPLLVRRGSATVSLKTASPFSVVALNCDGVPKGSVNVTKNGDAYSFLAKTDLYSGGIMAYHLTCAESP